ncbi:hypothetical protein K458DRAFT_376844 [Lentithecium fluviatile CBS 122367]|uniref:WD40 repeat-like protein n=1 Tax=Lentithecium fluviatile CBS 122367 TaxID=1168545 RepID=A0A6G1IJS1_9PLEO|nr:hypothetical protein K458DRAFT_376844 [Lentithecium fluviatile CBS 122367]
MAPGRPSRRTTQQPKSYRVDKAFEGLDIDLSDSEAEKEQGSGGSSDGAEEEESEVDEYTLADDDEEDDVDEFDDSAPTSNEEDGEDADVDMDEDVFGPGSDNEPGTTISTHKTPKFNRRSKGPHRKSDAVTKNKISGPKVQPPNRFNRGLGSDVRQRGVEEWVKGGQETRFKNFFGPTEEDYEPGLKSRDLWEKQLTLPSRSAGHLRRSFWVSDATLQKEMDTLRNWYEDTGQKYFEAGQTVNTLDEEPGQTYMFKDGPDSMNFLLGEIQKPQMHTMKRGNFLSTAQPFGPNPKRRGWSFNLGTRIQEVQWAPNEEGRTQYLAVAVEHKSTTARQYKSMRDPNPSVFTATPSFPASIQIWAFESVGKGDLDPSKPPRLEQVICTDWGAPKAFRWCPVALHDSVDSADENIVHLGLLAGIWSDGKVRVLDVKHRKSVQAAQYIHYSKAAFDIEIPETIPTCLQWLSSTTLAVATASGVLAIWTLTRPGVFPTSNPSDSRHFRSKPWFYKQITDTYILTLSSGYPSRPHFVSTTTVDGYDRIYDLRSPFFDSCASTRGRMLNFTQAWHEQTQSFLSPDEYHMLGHSPIRCYYRDIYAMRIVSSITCCATSPVHPCILVGGTDGMVAATNSTEKMMNTKCRPWQQPWFKHEWRRAVDELALKAEPAKSRVDGDEANGQPPAAGTPTDVATPAPNTDGSAEAPVTIPSAAILSQPLIRITEGYKAQKAGIAYPDDGTRRHKEGAKVITIFEEKTAITRVAWNPNLKFGTWAVAGTNSGYLRVEDLGD